MAMNQFALWDLVEALKAAGVDDRILVAAQNMYQALVDAEAEGVIGAGLWKRTQANGNPEQVETAGVVEHDRGLAIADPEAADRVMLPQPAEAAAHRPGPVLGGGGGLLARGVHPHGRRPGQGSHRGHQHVQVRGVTDLSRRGC